MQKERIALWDNLKFFLILAVVVGHLADSYTNVYASFRSLFVFIYSFHMPLFIFVSGLFFSEKKILRKIIYYIIAGFALKYAFMIEYAILENRYVFELLSDGSLPWFMFALAFMTAIAYACRNMNKWLLLAISVVLACASGYLTCDSDFLYWSRTIVFFPFFIIGMMLDAGKIAEFKKRKWTKPVGLLVLAAAAVIAFVWLDKVYDFRWLFTARNTFKDCGEINGPIGRLAAYGVSLITSAAVILLVPSRRIPLISKMGARSINVYFWHIIIINIIEYFVCFDGLVSSALGKALYLGLGVVLTLVLSIKYIWPFPMETIRKAIIK